MNINLEYSIIPRWEILNEIENKLKEYFKNIHNEDYKSETMFVINELIENAIKYGKTHTEIKGIKFSFQIDDKNQLLKYQTQ